MSSIVVAGDTSGTVTLSAPAVAGSSVLTLPASTGTVTATASAVSAVGQIPFSTDGSTWSSTAKIVSGTAVASTSGTSIDFTGIPSWAKRVTVMFNGVSTNGASAIQLQIGSGSIITTGYVGAGSYALNGSSVTGLNFTTGLAICISITGQASNIFSGHAILTLVSGNSWVMSDLLCVAGAATYNGIVMGAASLTLSSALDRVRITTVNGTDLFDAGSINIMYE